MIPKKVKKVLVNLLLLAYKCKLMRIFGRLEQALSDSAYLNSTLYMYTRQIFVLLWKNWLIRKRFYFSTFMEFCLPILVLIVQRYQAPSNSMLSLVSSITSISIEGLMSKSMRLESCVQTNMAYYPSNNFTDKIMNTLRGSNCTFDMISFDTLKEAFDFRNNFNASSNFSFVYFKKDQKYFTYTIDTSDNSELELETIQYHLNNGLMGHLLNRTMPNTAIEVYSTTPSIQIFFGPSTNWMKVAFYLHLIYLVSFQITIKRIVNEKESGARSFLKLMGMSDLAYWGSHFLDSFIMLALQGAIMTTLATTDWLSAPLLHHCSWHLYYLLFLSLGVIIIIFAFFHTIFFNKTITALIVSGFTWILSVALAVEKHIPEIQVGKAVPWSFSCKDFIPINCLVWVSKLLAHFESTSKEASLLQFILKYQASLLMILFLILHICLVYTFMIYYIEAIWPFQDGSPKPWNFIFKHSSHERNLKNIFAEWDVTRVYDRNMEPLPQGLEVGAKVIKMSKSFGGKGKNKYVVSKVSLEFAKGQIHVLLGHNGAGKTTLMNMISGLLAPTYGTAEIAGYDIQTQTTMAQANMSICPQQNLLFADLTVEEHLILFSVLKGVSFKNSYLNVANVLDYVRLKDKRYTLSRKLSGGMKRKLHFAITMVGNTKMIILDEPTSGLDPESRRIIWDILLKMKRNKTILLSTHIMEEADALGDRISVMYDGRLCCVGSTFFLKKLHGTGYILHLSLNEKFNQALFDETIKSSFSKAFLQRLDLDEAVYCLPDLSKATIDDTQDTLNSSSQNHQLSTFFDILEKQKEKLGILSFGVSITTMSDVFMKVVHSNLLSTTIETGYHLTSPRHFCKLTGVRLCLNQIKGLFLKRVNYAKRHWQFHVFQLLVPSAITYLGFFILNSFLAIILEEKQPVETLDLTTYPKRLFYIGSKLSSYFDKTVHELGGEVEFYDSITSLDLKRYDFGIVERVSPGSQVSDFVLWSNQQPYSVSIALTTLQNTLLNVLYPQKHHPLVTRTIQNQPPLAFVLIIPLFILNVLRVILPISLSFIASSFVLYPFKENQMRSKLVQRIAGVNGFIFWLSSFLFDIMYYAFVVIIVVIVIYFQDQLEAVSSHITSLGSSFLLYLFFGYTVIPLGYLASYLPLDNANTAFNFLTFMYQIFSIMATFMAITNKFFFKFSSSGLIDSFLSFFPTLSISEGLINVYRNGLIYKLCARVKSCSDLIIENVLLQFTDPDENILEICCAKNVTFQINYLNWSEKGILIRLSRMAIWGSVILIIVFVLESNIYYYWYWFISLIKYIRSPTEYQALDEDEDVAQEKQYVSQLIQRKEFTTEALLVNRLTKKYKNLLAVNNLSFSLHHKECFGLLGVNGAGKSTVFAMLTGDAIITHGNAYINRYDIKSQLLGYYSDLSYCPQFDALLENLSLNETLTLFARLKGVPECYIKENVAYLIEMFGLESAESFRASILSGGTKRKLSLALALIGSPSVILLDEPTTGIDPFSKKNIWSVLQLYQKVNSCSIVLSSHSMEESEALCSRVGIMIKGQFRCLGSFQHLRSKHVQGYNIIIKLNEYAMQSNDLEKIEHYIGKHFKKISYKELHGYTLCCFINDFELSYSQRFRIMEQGKELNLYDDFIISDVNLEQIFLSLLRK